MRFKPGDIVRITRDNQDAMTRTEYRDEASVGYIKRGEPWVVTGELWDLVLIKSLDGEVFYWTKNHNTRNGRNGLSPSCFELDKFLTAAARATEEESKGE